MIYTSYPKIRSIQYIRELGIYQFLFLLTSEQPPNRRTSYLFTDFLQTPASEGEITTKNKSVPFLLRGPPGRLTDCPISTSQDSVKWSFPGEGIQFRR